MRRKLAGLGILLLAAALGGCGSKEPDGPRYAMVTGAGGTATDPETAAVAEGLTAYATDRGYEAAVYTATEDTVDAIRDQFAAAASDGVKYVLSAGDLMEIPVYSAQNSHKKTSFVLVDGEPRKSADAKSSIRENTQCIAFDRPSLGFLAGYMAIREGYTSIAWVSGIETERSLSFGEGFLNGIASAASDQQLSPSSLTVISEYTGSELISPKRVAEAKQLYARGVQLIVTDSESLAKAISMAADASDRPFATVGFDAVAAYTRCQFSAMPNWSGATRYLLEYFEDAQGFDGGTTLVCGAKQSAVRLSADYSRIPIATEVDTQTILAKMANGEVIVSNADAGDGAQAPSASLTVTDETPETLAASKAADAQAQVSSGAELMVDMTTAS